MTECACIWQQWDKEKGGKMYYIIRDGYSVINEKDNIIVELNLKKLSDNFNIDYETIKDKYNKLIKNKKEVVRDIKPKKTYNKYGMAENYLIYYMLKNEKVLNMVENRVGYFPDKNIRELSNEIIYYFHKYGIINVADFISYISDREEILRTLRDIIACFNGSFSSFNFLFKLLTLTSL